MNKECIWREDAINACFDGWAACPKVNCNGLKISFDTQGILERVPAADVRPVVHAQWDADGRCSACGNRWNEYLHDDANDWGYFDPMPPFCNNCGATMDMEEV